jgi:exopolysaccharide biosynthesis polyprenyl glycosylphosphotransferase
LLGEVDRLPALVRLFDVERVVIAFSQDSHERTLDLIRSMKDMDVQIDVVPRLFEQVGPNFDIHTVEGIPLLGLPPPRLSRSSMLLKRIFDLALTVPGLIVLSPAFALFALLIKRDSAGPVFFRQVRMGCNGRTFRIWKFRTMSLDADERKSEFAHLNQHLQNGGDPRMFKIPDDPRVTRVGRWLRRHSLDELPQLFNVLRGEMSLVGPRPLILDEDQYVEEWARQRLNLKPGCTGPWQVQGGSRIPFVEMVKLDYLYVTGWSVLGDLKLVVRTLPLLVSGNRVSG